MKHTGYLDVSTTCHLRRMVEVFLGVTKVSEQIDRKLKAWSLNETDYVARRNYIFFFENAETMRSAGSWCSALTGGAETRKNLPEYAVERVCSGVTGGPSGWLNIRDSLERKILNGIDHRYPHALNLIKTFGDWDSVAILTDLVFFEKGVYSGGNIILVNCCENANYFTTYQVCRLHFSSHNSRFNLVQKFKGEK